MEKVQLKHPEGKKAPAMDKAKYDMLRTSFLACLSASKQGEFDPLMAQVEKDLKKRKLKVQGSLQWNLFWVTLDLEARKEIRRDRTKSPMVYTVAGAATV